MTSRFFIFLSLETDAFIIQHSMAHAAAIIKAEREADPDLLLLDTGDTTQANYIQSFLDEEPHPMIEAMNYLEYDAWTLGNHE